MSFCLRILFEYISQYHIRLKFYRGGHCDRSYIFVELSASWILGYTYDAYGNVNADAQSNMPRRFTLSSRSAIHRDFAARFTLILAGFLFFFDYGICGAQSIRDQFVALCQRHGFHGCTQA